MKRPQKTDKPPRLGAHVTRITVEQMKQIRASAKLNMRNAERELEMILRTYFSEHPLPEDAAV